MGLCLLRGDVKHDARCGLASSICGYSRIAVGRLEWFQTPGRLLCYVDFSLCANRNRIPNDPVASKDRRQGTDPAWRSVALWILGYPVWTPLNLTHLARAYAVLGKFDDA